jgi:chromosome segregation ATPase
MNNEEIPKSDDPKIKDFQIKLQVLKNAVLEERNKRGELEKEITKLKNKIQTNEDTIHDKELLIVNLSHEKYELMSALDVERNKSKDDNKSITDLLGGIFQRKESIGFDDRKLRDENINLKNEIELLKRKSEQQAEEFENCKSDYQNLLNTQMNKVKLLESSIIEKNKLIDENDKRLDIMFENYSKYDIERTKLQSSVNKLTDENKIKTEKICELLTKLEEKEEAIMQYKDSLKRHEVESTELAKKLAELKNAIIESNMIIQNFSGEKIGSLFNSPIDVVIIYIAHFWQN